MTASPIGDMAPAMVALNAVAVVQSAQGQRCLPMDQFLSGYRSTELAAGEVLVRIDWPHPGPRQQLGVYKVSKRRELDISTVALGALVTLSDTGVVEDIRLAFGGVAPRAGARAHQTCLLYTSPSPRD